MRIADHPWPRLGERPLVVVPVGSFEQHGPHLPLDTDTRIATAVARTTGSALAPALPYGASGEHEEFPGTVSLGTDALRTLLVEYGRSACRWSARVVFVNGHGGNGPALSGAVPLLRTEGRDVTWFACAPTGGDAHAGRTETSLMLAIAPHAVRTTDAAAGNTTPVGELMSRLRAGRLRALSPNGVLGDPAGASATEGTALLNDLAAELCDAVARWDPDEQGRLR